MSTPTPSPLAVAIVGALSKCQIARDENATHAWARVIDAHLAPLLKDRERLQWLKDNCAYFRWETVSGDPEDDADCVLYWPGDDGEYVEHSRGGEPEELIDAARSAKGTS